VRLALALCSLVLLAPAAALARKPVISYVDENGVFRLYDEELNAEVDPPPAVPANFLGFRYAISLNGRYIVFNDTQKKLHLLDRATNTQIPLPGVDVYAANGPGGLTVSDTGRIAFDDNGNGPAVVYESATGQFVDTGLPANNGHRQTRLSGDGLFLGTTCNDTNCVNNLDIGADPYVQDLTTKLDTGFPNDAVVDEEHPCINGDGLLFGFDKAPGLLQPFDVYLFDRSVSPPQAVALPGMNDAAKDETNCVLDAAGDYVGLIYDQAGTATFRVYSRASAAFLTLPPDKEFDSRSLFSAPYSPPPQGGGQPAAPPSGDRTKPVASRLRMTHRRFRPGPRATSFRFALSEPAGVRVVIRRRGRYVGTVRRSGLGAGSNRIPWSGRLRGRKLRPGPYVGVLIATDPAGNLSLPLLTSFRVLRPEGDRRL
jgi:hypothetical protein